MILFWMNATNNNNQFKLLSIVILRSIDFQCERKRNCNKFELMKDVIEMMVTRHVAMK
jgi:hypothetical protein